MINPSADLNLVEPLFQRDQVDLVSPRRSRLLVSGHSSFELAVARVQRVVPGPRPVVVGAQRLEIPAEHVAGSPVGVGF